MSTILQLNIQHTESLKPQSILNGSSSGASNSEIPSLHLQVNHLADSISDEAVRVAVSRVLADLVLLLDYLSLVEAAPQEPVRISERLSILDAVRGEAASLVDFIENHALQVDGLEKSLHETLDGAAYAIKHEIRRIFDGELAEITSQDQRTHGILLHAHGVLRNCFQQCMINLACVFDDDVCGARLFQDWRIRRERSLLLCRDLASLVDLLKDDRNQSLNKIAEHLRTFRQGSMQWLMYKDWQDYEALSEEVLNSISSGERPTDLLHCFCCYLETLLGHVKARAVLADSTLQPSPDCEEVAVSG